MQELTQELNLVGKRKYKLELIVALLLALVCSLAGASNLLFTSNDLYPLTSDAMGHMAKIKYMSECLSQGNIPSWFPYWYNGSTTTQYYVPLSYYIMIPIFWITNNIMLTFKINCILMMFIGGIGVWTFCYKKIGNWCGLVGIIAFCFQYFLTDSLYGAGLLAQGPIFAMMPWFLLIILTCAKKPTRLNFSLLTLLVTLLILSHAMHAFMVCVCTILVMLVFVLMKKITLINYFLTVCTIGLAGIMTAFWSVVGATGLENPGIPYLLPEASLFYTATIDWFTDNSSASFHYSISISILSIIAIIVYAFFSLKKLNGNNQSYYGLSAILLTVFTTIFSFGMHLPFYRYLPMATSMVPGRILSYTAVTGAICSAYAIYMLWTVKSYKILNRAIVVSILVVVMLYMNPYKYSYATKSSDFFDSMVKHMDTKSNTFDKGRYEWMGTIDCTETFFPLKYGFNTSDGWNIEGTPHNNTIWNFNIAFALKEYDYILKQLAYWNVRYLLLFQSYSDIKSTLLKDMEFKEFSISREGSSLFVSDKPSSYFLRDPRNAIAIGSCSKEISLTFPYITQSSKTSILDYSIEELLKYKVIYIAEQNIKTKAQQNKLENLITQLINNGSSVIIEPTQNRNFDIFDVHVTDERAESTPVFEATEQYPWSLDKQILLNNYQIGFVRSLYGLDEVYANFTQNDGKIKNAVIGTKKVGKGEVIFLGAHMSEYLEAINVKNYGIKERNETVINNSKIVKSIYEKIFESLGVSKTFLPEAFDVTSSNWDYQGGSFTYNNDTAQQITVSVTYAPRWTAKIDGKELKVGQC